MVGLDGLGGVIQPWRFCDSMKSQLKDLAECFSLLCLRVV